MTAPHPSLAVDCGQPCRGLVGDLVGCPSVGTWLRFPSQGSSPSERERAVQVPSSRGDFMLASLAHSGWGVGQRMKLMATFLYHPTFSVVSGFKCSTVLNLRVMSYLLTGRHCFWFPRFPIPSSPCYGRASSFPAAHLLSPRRPPNSTAPGTQAAQGRRLILQ